MVLRAAVILEAFGKSAAKLKTQTINYLHITPAVIFHGSFFFVSSFFFNGGSDTRLVVIEMGECDGRAGGEAR